MAKKWHFLTFLGSGPPRTGFRGGPGGKFAPPGVPGTPRNPPEPPNLGVRGGPGGVPGGSGGVKWAPNCCFRPKKSTFWVENGFSGVPDPPETGFRGVPGPPLRGGPDPQNWPPGTTRGTPESGVLGSRPRGVPAPPIPLAGDRGVSQISGPEEILQLGLSLAVKFKIISYNLRL